jgi:endonuclease YncB( thermonuclease family)
MFLFAITVGATAPALAQSLAGLVTAVHDGDTFTLDGRTKIRVFGTDAPKLHQQRGADAIHTSGHSSHDAWVSTRAKRWPNSSSKRK